MNREAGLAALAAAVFVGAAVVAVAAPGALADRTGDVRPSHLSLQDPRVSVGAVSGRTATLSLGLRMDHRGGDAENVSVEVQAVDSESGLVEATVRESVGTVSGQREVRARVNVSVEREGGYRIPVRLYQDGRRVDAAGTSVSGVGSLTPAYAETAVEFHRFESGADLPVIAFSSRATENNRTTLETETYLTNTGDEPAGGLELVVRARQAESNIIADSETVNIGEVAPGRTITPSASLTVPDGYNYNLDGILRRDGVIVGTVSAPALLDPSRPVPENGTREEVGFRTGDFDRTPREGQPDRPTRTASGSGPGFGTAAAVLALAAAAGIARYRSEP